MRVIIKKIERVLDDYFKVDKATLQYELFNGEMSEELIRLNFIRGHSVALLLYNMDTNSVILTQQFRYPVYAIDAKKGVRIGADYVLKDKDVIKIVSTTKKA